MKGAATMLKVRVFITLKEGFEVAGAFEPAETEFEFVIKARNHVTARRMVRAMLENATNVIEWDTVTEDYEN